MVSVRHCVFPSSPSCLWSLLSLDELRAGSSWGLATIHLYLGSTGILRHLVLLQMLLVTVWFCSLVILPVLICWFGQTKNIPLGSFKWNLHVCHLSILDQCLSLMVCSLCSQIFWSLPWSLLFLLVISPFYPLSPFAPFSPFPFTSFSFLKMSAKNIFHPVTV